MAEGTDAAQELPVWYGIPGAKYDIKAVIAATERIIAVLVDAIGEGDGCLVVPLGEGRLSCSYPEPATLTARAKWKEVHSRYDVTDHHVDFHIGPLVVQAFLFGNVVMTRMPDGRILRQGGRPLSPRSIRPFLRILGEEEPDTRKLTVPGTGDVQCAIEALKTGYDGKLPLEVRTKNVYGTRDGFPSRQRAWVRFSESHAARKGSVLRVRCTDESGAEVTG